MACPVGANDPVTYTLTISNQGRFNGHDLVVTDSIPAGTSLLTYTFASDDGATVTETQPAPHPRRDRRADLGLQPARTDRSVQPHRAHRHHDDCGADRI